MIKKPPFYGNHAACNTVGLFTFRHFVNKMIIVNAFNLLSTRSYCFTLHKMYFRYFSIMFRNIRGIFYDMYDIYNVFENDLDAVLSRIKFVEDREERSNYCVE